MNNIALLSDKKKRNNITVTIKGDKDLKMCMGDLCAFIPIKELYEMLLFITTEEQRANLLAFKKREMMKYVRQHSVRLKNDMKAGEMMVVNCEIDVPKVVVDSITNKEKGRSTK